MSEGTKVFDVQQEIEAIKRQIETLMAMPPWAFRQMGCICPPGAELGCSGLTCPRRCPPNVFRS